MSYCCVCADYIDPQTTVSGDGYVCEICNVCPECEANGGLKFFEVEDYHGIDMFGGVSRYDVVICDACQREFPNRKKAMRDIKAYWAERAKKILGI